ncbi:hypothetical protein ACHQM5_002368 [Ranunculus cassubicifolius]
MDETKNDQTILIPEEWSESVHRIASSSNSSSSPPISLICGPKNSGKSTFSRLLVNTLLQNPRYSAVAYLDTDVGQPEFTPPGCLSLNLITQPFPDMTTMYVMTPYRCIFFGDLSSKRDPETYKKSIFSLYDDFVTLSKKRGNPGKPMLPLVINTPGWVKGTGYDLLVSMLRYISPTHVVQIRISVQIKNLPLGAFWLDEQELGPEGLDVMEIYSAENDSFGNSLLTPKNAKHMRDMRMRSYFRQCFPSNIMGSSLKEFVYALCSHPPYEVPISSVKVIHVHEQVPSREIYRTLNATIVGLAVSSKKLKGGEPVTTYCVGLGIVRAIDISKKLLYILTPVPHRDLINVDLLLQGYIEIPVGWLEVQGCRSPYVSENVLPFLGTCY